MEIIPEKLRKLLSSNEIRGLVLGSLALQIGLIFLAPLRKRSSNSLLTLTLWVFYLAADSVATLAIGNVLSNQRDAGSSTGDSGTIPPELTALWAPFLLLHLAGPDTITSYSIEDNELWWRHLLGLVVQVSTAAITFFQSPPNKGLWIPTILMFVPGVIKFIERILALRSGSRDNLNDAISLEQHDHPIDPKADFVSTSSHISESEREREFVLEGYKWFSIFKRLLVDVTFTTKQLLESQDRFSEVSPQDAFKLVSIELSMLYDILHTKAVQIHCYTGGVFRCSCVASIIVALAIFHNYLDEQKYTSPDIIISYILFCVGLGLEVISAVILLFSDWMVRSVGQRFGNVITTIVNGKRRWSRTIGQCNLVGLCVRDKDTVALIMMNLKMNFEWTKKLKRKWDSMRETKPVALPESLLFEEMMFKEAKRRAQNVHIYDVLVKARKYRGNKALERHGQLEKLGWSLKKEFDECIILWHIATDICINSDQEFRKNLCMPIHSKRVNPSKIKEMPYFSWILSNYMIYLLTQQPSMLQLGYGKKRFEETCTDAKKILKEMKKPEETQACQLLLEKTAGNGGNSVLAEGCSLAKHLQGPDKKINWQLIVEVWMEMLGYAAIHCESYQHAKALSRGGELLTHLWLLMAQLGVVEEHKTQQFQSASV